MRPAFPGWSSHNRLFTASSGASTGHAVGRWIGKTNSRFVECPTYRLRRYRNTLGSAEGCAFSQDSFAINWIARSSALFARSHRAGVVVRNLWSRQFPSHLGSKLWHPLLNAWEAKRSTNWNMLV